MSSLPTLINTDALPSSQKSALRRWFESSQGPLESKLAKAKLHAKAGMSNLRAGGEAAVISAGLGALHANLQSGLDYKGKYPIDAALAVVGLVGGTILAQEEYGQDLSNVGVAAMAVFSFRKGHDLAVDMKDKAAGITPGGGAASAGGNTKITKASFAGDGDGWATGSRRLPRMAGDFGQEDPIVRLARSL